MSFENEPQLPRREILDHVDNFIEFSSWLPSVFRWKTTFPSSEHLFLALQDLHDLTMELHSGRNGGELAANLIEGSEFQTGRLEVARCIRVLERVPPASSALSIR